MLVSTCKITRGREKERDLLIWSLILFDFLIPKSDPLREKLSWESAKECSNKTLTKPNAVSIYRSQICFSYLQSKMTPGNKHFSNMFIGILFN
jgi:hypothetical protein